MSMHFHARYASNYLRDSFLRLQKTPMNQNILAIYWSNFSLRGTSFIVLHTFKVLIPFKCSSGLCSYERHQQFMNLPRSSCPFLGRIVFQKICISIHVTIFITMKVILVSFIKFEKIQKKTNLQQHYGNEKYSLNEKALGSNFCSTPFLVVDLLLLTAWKIVTIC